MVPSSIWVRLGAGYAQRKDLGGRGPALLLICRVSLAGPPTWKFRFYSLRLSPFSKEFALARKRFARPSLLLPSHLRALSGSTASRGGGWLSASLRVARPAFPLSPRNFHGGAEASFPSGRSSRKDKNIERKNGDDVAITVTPAEALVRLRHIHTPYDHRSTLHNGTLLANQNKSDSVQNGALKHR